MCTHTHPRCVVSSMQRPFHQPSPKPRHLKSATSVTPSRIGVERATTDRQSPVGSPHGSLCDYTTSSWFSPFALPAGHPTAASVTTSLSGAVGPWLESHRKCATFGSHQHRGCSLPLTRILSTGDVCVELTNSSPCVHCALADRGPHTRSCPHRSGRRPVRRRVPHLSARQSAGQRRQSHRLRLSRRHGA